MAKSPTLLFAFAAIAVTTAVAQQTAPPSTPATAPTTPAAPAPGTPAPIEPPIAAPAAPQLPPPPIPGDAPIIPGSAPIINPGTTTTLSTTPASGAAPGTSRLNEFQGDEIGLVLRTLARQAGKTLIVSDKVSTTAGTVTARIENKTPMQAIGIIVDSKGLVMDEKEEVLYVKTQEERAKEPTESGSFTLSYAQAKDVLPLLQTQLASGQPPQFDQRTNTVFFRETKSNMDKILLFLESVDKPTQQVMIEARLVEVAANPQQNYGINWSGVVGGANNPQLLRYGGSTLGSSRIDQQTNPVTGAVNPVVVPSTLPAVTTNNGQLSAQDFLFGGGGGGNPAGLLGALGGQFAILSAPQLSATLRLLNEDRDSEFLANPRVVTANNQKADIKITQARPVPQLNFNEQTAQAVFSGFQDKEFGNTLEVTPSINKDEFISLLVKPEISTTPGDVTFTFGGASVSSPIIDRRTLTSNVLIKSGDTLAIGGLLQDEVTKGRTKVPILGDIPILGYAFQERRNTRTKRNLLVFVTPTLIKQGYGTGLEDQVNGLHHSGEEYADPNGWRNNAKGALRLVPTSQRQVAADAPKPGIAKAPKKISYKVRADARAK